MSRALGGTDGLGMRSSRMFERKKGSVVKVQ